MSPRVRVALALLQAERRALEHRIRPHHFDLALSRSLDAIILAIEAIEMRPSERPPR